MNRDRVLSEYLRLLKPGGNMALLENLPYNPLINIYRILRRLTATSQAETDYIDSIKGYINSDDIDRLTSYFRLVEQQEYHLLGMSSIYLLKNRPFSSAALLRIWTWFAHMDMVCDANPGKAARLRPRADLFSLNSRQETRC